MKKEQLVQAAKSFGLPLQVEEEQEVQCLGCLKQKSGLQARTQHEDDTQEELKNQTALQSPL